MKRSKQAHAAATIDPDFAKDGEAAIAARREPLEPPELGVMLDSTNARQRLESVFSEIAGTAPSRSRLSAGQRLLMDVVRG
jgi:hypothetical protein